MPPLAQTHPLIMRPEAAVAIPAFRAVHKGFPHLMTQLLIGQSQQTLRWQGFQQQPELQIVSKTVSKPQVLTADMARWNVNR